MTTVTELLGNPESVGVWDLVPERSRITFRNKTMWGALRVHGVFTELCGDGQISDTGRVYGRVDVKAASLNTKLRRRDEDLRHRHRVRRMALAQVLRQKPSYVERAPVANCSRGRRGGGGRHCWGPQ